MTGRLEIEGVYTAYDKADVLEGVSLKIEPGRITCLLGSNGSGKTTLIRSILGLTPARAGHITFDGQDFLSHNWSSRLVEKPVGPSYRSLDYSTI